MKRILLCVMLLAQFGVYAQATDTLFLAKSVGAARQFYNQRIKSESILYNGVDFAEYRPLEDEHPYYSYDWLPGTVFYDGQLFDSVYLLYNISTDNIYIENYNFGNNIQLINERVDYFTLADKLFVVLNEPSMPPGYYEVLHQGPTKTIAKRKKQFEETVYAGAIQRAFIEKPKYYIYQNDRYVQVSSKKSVLALMGDHRQEVNKKLLSKGISFKRDKEKAIVTMVELYDAINQ